MSKFVGNRVPVNNKCDWKAICVRKRFYVCKYIKLASFNVDKDTYLVRVKSHFAVQCYSF
jgi:hypothetical protein